MITELSEANVTIEKATNMIGLVAGSLEQAENYKRTRGEEAAKLQEELQREKALRKGAWTTLEDERRVHKEGLLLEKAAFDAVLEEKKELRGVVETRIEALEGELKDARTELNKTEADLNKARVRICTAVADFKNRPAFENFIESKRQQWIWDFDRSTGFQAEMQQTTLTGANRVLGKLNILHPERNVFEEVKRPRPRQ